MTIKQLKDAIEIVRKDVEFKDEDADISHYNISGQYDIIRIKIRTENCNNIEIEHKI